MKPSSTRLPSALVLSVCVLLLPAVTARATDKKDVINRARAAYYSLKAKGLVEFQCNMTPDWESLLKDARQADPAGADRAIQTLKQLQFGVSLSPGGSAKITHTTVKPTNHEMAQGLEKIYGGMEQMVAGFFDTWSPFMMTSPLPEANINYKLVEATDQWNLSYTDGAAEVFTTMGKDLAVRQLRVRTAEFNSTLLPQFTKGQDGFLLTGYEAEYYGKSPSETTKLNVGISYQEVNGLELPQKLSLGGSYGGTPFQVYVTFYGCQAKKSP